MAAAQVREVFGDVSLYEILGVPKTADAAAIKKGFYRKSLSYHPDKDPSPGAKDRFQALCFVHTVLSDPDKRAEYDRTGSLEDAEDATNEEAFEAWYSYWRGMFPAVTTADIEEFEKSYRGSAEEEADVLAAYTSCKGDMDEMLTVVMCSNEGDADRFAAMVHAAIADGTVKALPAFTKVYGKSAADASAAPKAAARAKAAAARAAAAAAEAAAAEEMLAEARRQYKADAKAAKAGAIVVRGGAGGSGSGKAAAAVSDDEGEDEEEGSSAGAGARARAGGGAGSAASSAGSSSRGKAASASAGKGGKASKAGKAAARADDEDDDDDDGPEPSLEDLIRMRSSQRAAGFGSMLSSLEAKYGASGGSGSGSGSSKAKDGAKGKGSAAKGKGRGGKKAAAKAEDSDDDDDDEEEEAAASAAAPSTKRGRKT